MLRAARNDDREMMMRMIEDDVDEDGIRWLLKVHKMPSTNETCSIMQQAHEPKPQPQAMISRVEEWKMVEQ